jgi:hypothetical protein
MTLASSRLCAETSGQRRRKKAQVRRKRACAALWSLADNWWRVQRVGPIHSLVFGILGFNRREIK